MDDGLVLNLSINDNAQVVKKVIGKGGRWTER